MRVGGRVSRCVFPSSCAGRKFARFVGVTQTISAPRVRRLSALEALVRRGEGGSGKKGRVPTVFDAGSWFAPEVPGFSGRGIENAASVGLNMPGGPARMPLGKDDPFARLRLAEIQTGRVHCRQHSNPLKRELATVPSAEDVPAWNTVFADASKPLVLDLGCGQGRWSLMMATDERWGGGFKAFDAPRFMPRQAAGGELEAAPEAQEGNELEKVLGEPERDLPVNHLALEIRQKLVTRARVWARGLSLEKSVHFAYASANSATKAYVEAYPGPLALACVQFPDPHFKAKHHKRRKVQPALVRDLAAVQPQGAKLYVVSDVLEVAQDMALKIDALSELYARVPDDAAQRWLQDPCPAAHWQDDLLPPASRYERAKKKARTEESSGVTADDSTSSKGVKEGSEPHASSAPDCWLSANPFGVETEREVMNAGEPIYRVLYQRL